MSKCTCVELHEQLKITSADKTLLINENGYAGSRFSLGTLASPIIVRTLSILYVLYFFD